MSGSCVTSTSVMPRSRLSRWKISITSTEVRESSAPVEADRVQSLGRAPAALGRVDARVEHRQLDVLKRRRAREQVEALKDEAELAQAYVGALVLRERRHVAAAER